MGWGVGSDEVRPLDGSGAARRGASAEKRGGRLARRDDDDVLVSVMPAGPDRSRGMRLNAPRAPAGLDTRPSPHMAWTRACMGDRGHRRAGRTGRPGGPIRSSLWGLPGCGLLKYPPARLRSFPRVTRASPQDFITLRRPPPPPGACRRRPASFLACAQQPHLRLLPPPCCLRRPPAPSEAAAAFFSGPAG